MAKRFDVEVTWTFSMEVPDSWNAAQAEEAIDWDLPLDGQSLILTLAGEAQMTDEYREQVDPPEISLVEIEDDEVDEDEEAEEEDQTEEEEE